MDKIIIWNSRQDKVDKNATSNKIRNQPINVYIQIIIYIHLYMPRTLRS